MALKKNLLIIKHGALGDFILSFGPFKSKKIIIKRTSL